MIYLLHAQIFKEVHEKDDCRKVSGIHHPISFKYYLRDQEYPDALVQHQICPEGTGFNFHGKT